MDFLKKIVPQVEEWNRLASTPYNFKNEDDMYIEEVLEEIDAVCDQIFVLIGTAYKEHKEGMPERHSKLLASHAFHLFDVIERIYRTKGEYTENIALEHFREVIDANNEKLIPTPQGVHTEQKGENQFKIGKPEGWTPPNHRKIFDKYFYKK